MTAFTRADNSVVGRWWWTVDRWTLAGRTAAIIGGVYCLSSNRCGVQSAVTFGGAGWIINPAGEVLGVTSNDAPFLTLDVDLDVAEAAKNAYPRYVKD